MMLPGFSTPKAQRSSTDTLTPGSAGDESD